MHHSGWNVDMAMKRPKAEVFDTEEQKKLFTDECENWIKLGLHPNIVYCFYVREIDGVPCIFSEWMNNGDLERHITEKTLYQGTEEAVRERLLNIAIQFARGLRYAHEQGLIHRDAKPSNLLLSETWEAKVSDFGLAKARTVLMQAQDGGDKEYMTRDYCSPEQAKRHPLTPQTDIYSWAVSILEMYLGDSPWVYGPVAGNEYGGYFANCEGQGRPIPPDLQELLARCLEEEPKDRPKDFGEIEAALLVIYKAVTGEDYPRPEPRALIETADSLNNRALSYLDLGKPEEAKKLWNAALENKPGHPESIFNRALFRWRTGNYNVDKARAEVIYSSADKEQKKELLSLLDQEADGTMLLPERPLPAVDILAQLKDMEWSEDGRFIYGTIKDRATWIVWDAERKEQLYRLKESDVYTHGVCHGKDRMLSFSLSRDGRFALPIVLSGDFQKETLLVIELDSGQVAREIDLRAWGQGIYRARLSPDNSILAVSKTANEFHIFHNVPFPEHDDYETIFIRMDTGAILSRAKGCVLLGYAQNGSLIFYDKEDRLHFSGHMECPMSSEEGILTEAVYESNRYAPDLYLVGEKLGLIELNTFPYVRQWEREILVCDLRRGVVLNRIHEQTHTENFCFGLTTDKKWLLWLNYSDIPVEISSYIPYFPFFLVYALDAETGRYVFRAEPFQAIRRGIEKVSPEGMAACERRMLSAIAEPSSLRFQPGPQAEYHLCRIEQIAARLSAQQRFDAFLREAAAAEAVGDTAEAHRCVDKALALKNYENSPFALRRRVEIASGLRKTLPIRIIPTIESAPPKVAVQNPKLSWIQPYLEREKDDLREWLKDQIVGPARFYARLTDISRDGRRALMQTAVVFDFDDSMENIDVIYDAIVLDTQTRETVYECILGDVKNPVTCNEYDNWTSGRKLGRFAKPFDMGTYKTVMDSSGEFLLKWSNSPVDERIVSYGSSGPFRDELIVTRISTKEREVLLDEKLRSACFLDNMRYILCLSEEDGNTFIFDTANKRKLASFSFRDAEYGAIRYINDDCFAIEHNGEEKLCWIVWDYEV